MPSTTTFGFSVICLNSNVIAVIVGTLLAGYFGFKKYRAQKIWGNIEKRYFQEGIEDLISYLNHLRTTIEDNYENCTRVIKYFRDLNYKSFLEWFDKSQKSISERALSSKIPSSFLIISPMMKNTHFDKLCLSIFAEIAGINDCYISDIILGLIKVAREPISAKIPKEGIVKKTISEAQKRYSHVDKELGLYNITMTLEKILFELRKMNISSYEKLKNSFKDPKVVALLKDLEKIKVPKNY